jgi:hypothetical protein
MTTLFPNPVGIRSGLAVFLFRNVDDMREASRLGEWLPKRHWRSRCRLRLCTMVPGHEGTNLLIVGSSYDILDDPSSVLPHPAGYRHDMSLIAGSDLPNVLSPPAVRAETMTPGQDGQHTNRP